MPARPRIAALVAGLALAAPPAALAQSGGGGGAGDSQYQDPFGSSTPSTPKAKPKAPTAQQAPAQTSPPDQAPAPAATAPAAQAQATDAQTQAVQAQRSGEQTLPRTGFDVLPVAAIGLVLLLGGLALWRRPHAGR
jgi:LPXTG-motif cell wall-anchored protein